MLCSSVLPGSAVVSSAYKNAPAIEAAINKGAAAAPWIAALAKAAADVAVATAPLAEER